MAKLTSAHKRLIVQRLATFVAPSEIVAELKESGVVVSLQQVGHYDPEGKGSDVAQEWRELHKATREQFVKDTAGIAITHKSYRLRELGDMYRRAKLRNNLPLAAQLLEQAAKESGDAFTNRRELTGKDGKPLMPGLSFDDLTESELLALAQKMAAVEASDE